MSDIREDSSSWHQKILFHWVSPLIRVGTTRPVGDEDLLSLNEAENSQSCGEQFNDALMREKKTNSTFVLSSIWRVHRKSLLFISAIALVNLSFSLANPFLIRELLAILNGQAAAGSLVWKLATLLMLSALLANLSIHHLYHAALKLGMRIRAGLVYAIYRKAIQLSPASRAQSTTGEIVNLMASDAARIYNVASMIHLVWTVPLQVVVITCALFALMGTSTLAGLGVMLLMFVLSSNRAKNMMSARKNLMQQSDRRVGLISEILNGIRVIKFYCWEKSFARKITALRKNEIKELNTLARDSALVNILFASTPLFVGFATFATHLGLGKELKVEDVFGALAFFGILRPAMSQLPMIVSGLIDAKISIRRINHFLSNPEVMPREVTQLAPGEVKIKAGVLHWGDAAFSLALPDIHISPGELVLVLGPVGSGKSSFLHALLNELENSNNLVSVAGRIAFAPQQAWIMQGTVRENIVLSNDPPPDAYEHALRVCALEEDIEQLPAGDATEIGERGVNLSGGQKQRIALARCVVSNADLVLLDSALSAVDSRTAQHIFHHSILKTLKKKTRILVTQNYEHIRFADRVLWCHNGSVRELSPSEAAQLNRDNTQSKAAHFPQSLENQSAATPMNDAERVLTKSQQNRRMPTLSPISLQSTNNTGVTSNAPHGRLIVDEERAVGAVDKQHYKTYFSALAPARIGYFLLFIFTLREVLSTGNDSWLAWWTKNPKFSTQSFLLILAALGICAAGSTFARTYLLARRGVVAASGFHEALLNGVLRAPMSFFERTPTGRILNRFGKDTEAIDQYIPNTLLDALTCLFAIASTFTLITLVSPLALLAFVPLAFLYLRVQKQFRATSREVKRLESTSRSPMYAHFSESLAGASIIRSFEQSDFFLAENLRRFDGNQKAFYTMISINRWLGTRLELIGALVLGCTAFSGILMQEHISASFVGVSLTYALLATGSLNWAVRMISELESSMNAIERVRYYAKTPSENWEGDFQKNNWPLHGSIELRNLTLGYRPDLPPVLNRINLRIRAGERIGLIGRTGSGKSTLLQTLFRIIEPPDASVFIDGVDVKTIPLEQLRASIAVIPQDPVLFSGTLRENLDPFENHSDDEILNALSRAHLGPLLNALPDKLNQILNEGGSNLSVGQRQQVCLARALLRNSRILLLDEATANVDPTTDALIQSTLREAFADCTVVSIAHRIHTVLHCDRIVVLSAGQVAECASPQELMANKESLFAHYWAHSRLELGLQ